MSYIQSVAQVNVQIAEIKGLYNQEIADLCLSWRDKKISNDPNATGNEDSRIPDHQYIDQLKDKVTTIFHADIDDRYFLSEIWAHVLEDGETTMIHSHRNPKDYEQLYLSWVYYPLLPNNMKGGKLVFQMQEHARTRNFQVTPKTGLFVIFPSWLPHYTTRNETGGMRLSISGNCKIREEDYVHVHRDRSSGIHKFYGGK